jgi:pimeloyl-ACP methyl ester carboxylesterase
MDAPANKSLDVSLSALARRCGIDFVDATPPVRRECIARDGVRLSYLDWGGAGDPIVFLHGGALTGHTWDLVCIGLRDAHRCIALDLRGHGDSGWSDDYRIETATEDVAALATALDAARCHLVGMSLGGNIAAALLVNPHMDRDKLVYRLTHSMQRTDDGRYRWKVDRRRPHDYDHILGKLAELPALAPNIRCPVLIARGGRSRIFSDDAAARCAALFENGTWVRIEEAGHNVQEDNPRALLAALSSLYTPTP